MFLEHALSYSEFEEYGLSIDHFKRALALGPKSPKAWNNIVKVCLQLCQWDQAIVCFQKAAKDIQYRTPHFAYNNLGLVY
ncbi:MAG: tetratricopeptide repeat protein [Deltaproteobacteria bacterium]|nr:tetratricopeptide repeat protein [Deltaproteobacteria bacterium]